jgi:ribosomal protein S18 acetylase RimI-like enzyme
MIHESPEGRRIMLLTPCPAAVALPKGAIALRFADAADAEIIAALAIHVFLDTYATAGTLPELAAEAFAEYGVAAFRARLAERHRKFLLAEQGAGLIGFAEMLTSAREAPGAHLLGAELVRLYVQPRAHRRGIGRALLRQVEAIAIDTGLSALWFTVWEGNANALAFYAAQGYAAKGATSYSFRGRQYRNHVMARKIP